MAAEAVLTFAAEGILKKVLSLAQKEFSLACGFKAELKKLQESVTHIELLLLDVAEQPQGRLKSVDAWVKKLKDVAEDAEDVFDELEYEVYRRKVEIQDHMKKKVLNFFSLSNPLAFCLIMAHKLQKINASLVDLESRAYVLRLDPKNKVATTQGIRWDRQTNAFIGEDEIIVGRKDDVSKIVTTLTDSKYNQENLAVMAIVGMGGLGKTTLAKSVYKEDSIHKFFEKKIWICVSDPFDVNSILHQMTEQLNWEKGPSKDNQNTLLLSLNKELKDKKYLLVLDDVWNENSEIWESFMECLSKLSSAKGSKIIVTTRKDEVALTSERLLPRHVLGSLSGDECWSIMKNRAFTNNSDPEFDTIGREIAENCRGVPLVAKVLGGILHTKKSIEEWSSFKNSQIWNNLLKEKDRIMSVLRLSFDNLESPSLKQCFAYCSMFEKDVEIQRDNLIQLWMAQGLLCPSSDGSKDMEDIGNEYFDILLQSSLFQDVTMSDNDMVSKCKMHDLVHDLAEHLFKSESLTRDLCGVDNKLEIRHVARVSTSTLEKIPEGSARKLQSLFFYYGEVPTNILPQFKALRVLNLSKANIEEFPVSVGRLKHLRYLDISSTRFQALPKSIGKLYNLQTLRATKCALEEFPKELQNLINLRHIYFDVSTKFPQGIGRLTCLRTLPRFLVGSESGRRIEELAGLKQLKGGLIVCNLEHVKNREEAKKAKLEDKTKVRHLSFNWTKDRPSTDNNEEEDILQGLQPHLELESLRIENFMGDKFPTWMMSGSLMPNKLKKIELLGCDKCEGVPPLGHLTNLTELKIKGMANLKCVGAEFYGYGLVDNVATRSALFPVLKVLYIYDCGDLIEWVEAPLMSTIMVFPCLERLEIEDCGRLSRLPSGFKNCTSLQEVSINKCDGLSGPLSIGASLVELTIRKCNNLTSVEIKGSGSLTASLQNLTIQACGELSSIPALPQQCPSLQELRILGCPKLASFCAQSSRIDEEECISLQSTSDLRTMTSLRLLVIYNCERLESWVSSLQFPLSLEYLAIEEISNLEILPSFDHLHSLPILSIVNWRNLKYLPTGLQWPTGLKHLSIGCFWEELDSFPFLDFQVGSLMHLTGLALHGWPKLKSLPQQIQHLTSLTYLGIYQFEGVETLPEWLGSLTSLTQLEICSCKNLMNLPSLQAMQRLTKLQSLLFSGCHPLLKERCRRGSGTDWPKISRIQNIRIRGRDF